MPVERSQKDIQRFITAEKLRKTATASQAAAAGGDLTTSTINHEDDGN